MSINFLTYQWAQKNNLQSSFFEKTTSTNDIAKSFFPKSKENFHLYLADHQSQGRGRKENSWENLNKGEVLLSTWCFKLKQSPQPVITPLLGLALWSSVLEIKKDLILRIKAPNDLYLNNTKVGGLLIESIQQGDCFFLMVGLGLNVLNSPQTKQPTTFLATSMEINNKVWFSFCTKIYKSFEKAIEKGQKKKLSQKDTEELKSALNFGLPENKKYLHVSPECNLTNSQETLLWTEL